MINDLHKTASELFYVQIQFYRDPYVTGLIQINLKCDCTVNPQLSGYIAQLIPTIPNFKVDTTNLVS